MTITLKEIKEQFDIWNEKAFNNELPIPTFELMKTKSLLGQFCPRKVMGVPTYKIRISIYYDRPLSSYIDTIVHEMLHYYIKFKGIKDSSSHGRIWKKMARDLSRKFSLTITRTNPAGGGVSETIIEEKSSKHIGKFEHVFVCKMRDGHYGAGVSPSNKIYRFKPLFDNWNAVGEYKIVKAPWSQTYMLRHMRTCGGVKYITKQQYEELLKNKEITF